MYVGGSVDITGRYTFHRFMLRRGLHKTKALQELWSLDGEAAFEFFTLERCLKNVLLEREDFWIAQTPDRLNTMPSAVTGKHSGGPSEIKKAAARRRWARPEYRAKREAWLANRTHKGQFKSRDQHQTKAAHGPRHEEIT